MRKLSRVQWDALAGLAHAVEHGCGVLAPEDIGKYGNLTLLALAGRRLVTLAEEEDGDGIELWRITLGGMVMLRARHAKRVARAAVRLAPRPWARARRGARKLTEGQVREVRALAASTPVRALSRHFGMSRASVRDILAGRTYQDVV